MIDMKGKVIIVTGAARGFGAEFSRTFAAAGGMVVLTDILEEEGLKTAAGIKASGGSCHFLRHDVRDDNNWESIIKETVSKFGGLDILINNAGIEITSLLVNTDPEECRRIFDINILGTMLGIKHGFRAMMPLGAAGKGGVILNLSSVAALTSTPGVAAYSATKSAVKSLTEVAAVEAGSMKYGVRVNCLCPGLIETDLGKKLIDDFARLGLVDDAKAIATHVLTRTPLGRLGTPPDVANAALYLCSDAASFITGVSFPVDGGMSLT